MPSKAKKSRQMPGSHAPVYQLKITLKDTKPPVWRRILMPADMPLDALHATIQFAMGWTFSHLHQFMIGTGAATRFIGTHDPFMPEMDVEDETTFTIASLLPVPKKKLNYEYDFGDSWMHEILLEKILPPDPAMHHPVCLAGANACPPEDCGGTYGYYDLLETIGNPQHPEHDEMKEWLGGDFDPAEFDLDEVNATLKSSIEF